MKKVKMLPLVGIVILIIAIVLVLCFITNSNKNETESIRQQYLKLTKTEQSHKETAKELSKIYKKISKGNETYTEEYAFLFEEISGISLGENKSQVFRASKEYADVYKKMSKGFDDFGVSDLKISENGDSEFSLIFEQIGAMGYSVKQLNADELLYIGGETPKPRDESLGENIILVTFNDEGFNKEFCKKHPVGEVQELKNVPSSLKSKIKIVRASLVSDSAYGIYICSDEPIYVSEQVNTKVINPMSDIEIIMSIKKQAV